MTLERKWRIEISCELSAIVMIHMKCPDIVSVKNNKKIKNKMSAAVVIGALRF